MTGGGDSYVRQMYHLEAANISSLLKYVQGGNPEYVSPGTNDYMLLAHSAQYRRAWSMVIRRPCLLHSRH